MNDFDSRRSRNSKLEPAPLERQMNSVYPACGPRDQSRYHLSFENSMTWPPSILGHWNESLSTITLTDSAVYDVDSLTHPHAPQFSKVDASGQRIPGPGASAGAAGTTSTFDTCYAQFTEASPRSHLGQEDFSIGMNSTPSGTSYTSSTESRFREQQPVGNSSCMVPMMNPVEHRHQGSSFALEPDRGQEKDPFLVELPHPRQSDVAAHHRFPPNTHSPDNHSLCSSVSCAPVISPGNEQPKDVSLTRMCSRCKRTYTGTCAQRNLARHMAAKHPSADDLELTIQCKLCPRVYKRNDALRKHQRAKHPELKLDPPVPRKSSNESGSTDRSTAQ